MCDGCIRTVLRQLRIYLLDKVRYDNCGIRSMWFRPHRLCWPHITTCYYVCTSSLDLASLIVKSNAVEKYIPHHHNVYETKERTESHLRVIYYFQQFCPYQWFVCPLIRSQPKELDGLNIGFLKLFAHFAFILESRLIPSKKFSRNLIHLRSWSIRMSLSLRSTWTSASANNSIFRKTPLALMYIQFYVNRVI